MLKMRTIRVRTVHLGTRHCPGSHALSGPDRMTFPGDNVKATERWNVVRGAELKATKGHNFVWETRNIIDKSKHDDAESIGSNDDPRHQSWENTSETTSNSGVSEIVIFSLLVEGKQGGLHRKMYQDPDRDRYTSDEDGTVVGFVAD